MVLIEVKSGNTNITQLNHFIQTVETKKADMGIFVCFDENTTTGMLKAAKKQGYFKEESFKSLYDKIQIITVEDLLSHKAPNLPKTTKTVFKTAQKKTSIKDTQTNLFQENTNE